MAVIINYVAPENEYVCVHGQLRLDENTLVGDYNYSFFKVVTGTHIDTPRQFLENFDTYQEMYNRFSSETTVPEEEML